LTAAASQTPDLEKLFTQIRSNLLQLVNEEREVEKLKPLEFDDLATKVATAHAHDMATRDFASHWGSNGFKPYMRYSFAGGAHATKENVSAADNTWSMRPADLIQDTSYLHVRLYQEQPPNDGHRQAILAPHNTHVGFGLAVEKLRLRLVEVFVAKYVEVNSSKQKGRTKETFEFSGRLLKANYLLSNIEVFYEPLPSQPELDWLRQPRSYSLPNESVVLAPKLAPPLTYADRRKGVIDVRPDGSFTTPINLFQDDPGIYTIVCWLRRSSSEKAFPATEFCVRAE
jgi:uncharacterized protein YkwD